MDPFFPNSSKQEFCNGVYPGWSSTQNSISLGSFPGVPSASKKVASKKNSSGKKENTTKESKITLTLKSTSHSTGEKTVGPPYTFSKHFMFCSPKLRKLVQTKKSRVVDYEYELPVGLNQQVFHLILALLAQIDPADFKMEPSYTWTPSSTKLKANKIEQCFEQHPTLQDSVNEIELRDLVPLYLMVEHFQITFLSWLLSRRIHFELHNQMLSVTEVAKMFIQ